MVPINGTQKDVGVQLERKLVDGESGVGSLFNNTTATMALLGKKSDNPVVGLYLRMVIDRLVASLEGLRGVPDG